MSDTTPVTTDSMVRGSRSETVNANPIGLRCADRRYEDTFATRIET